MKLTFIPQNGSVPSGYSVRHTYLWVNSAGCWGIILTWHHRRIFTCTCCAYVELALTLLTQLKSAGSLSFIPLLPLLPVKLVCTVLVCRSLDTEGSFLKDELAARAGRATCRSNPQPLESAWVLADNTQKYASPFWMYPNAWRPWWLHRKAVQTEGIIIWSEQTRSLSRNCIINPVSTATCRRMGHRCRTTVTQLFTELWIYGYDRATLSRTAEASNMKEHQ